MGTDDGTIGLFGMQRGVVWVHVIQPSRDGQESRGPLKYSESLTLQSVVCSMRRKLIFSLALVCNYLTFSHRIRATDGPGLYHWVGISEVRKTTSPDLRL